jgi:ubiquitin C-terminal hydrolase
MERIRQHTLASHQDSKSIEGIHDSNNIAEICLKPHEENETTEAEGENPRLIMVKEMATIRTLQQKSRLRKSDSQALDISPAESTAMSPTESQQAWSHYLTKNDSIVTEIFGGQLQSSIECQTCHHKSFCFDPFLDLSLPLGAGSSKCTVENCLEAFTGPSFLLFLSQTLTVAPEFLEGENAYFCEKCNKKQTCVKRFNISKCPRILVILLPFPF